jgi:hypothetical protein
VSRPLRETRKFNDVCFPRTYPGDSRTGGKTLTFKRRRLFKKYGIFLSIKLLVMGYVTKVLLENKNGVPCKLEFVGNLRVEIGEYEIGSTLRCSLFRGV